MVGIDGDVSEEKMNRRHYLSTCCLSVFAGCFSGRREGSRAERAPKEEPTTAKRFGLTDTEYTLTFGDWFVHGYDATRIDGIELAATLGTASGRSVDAEDGTRFVFVEATKKNLDDTEWRLWFPEGWAVIAAGMTSDFGDVKTASGQPVETSRRYPDSWIHPGEHREVPPHTKVRLWAVTSVSALIEKPSIEVGFTASTDEDDHNVRWAGTE